MERELIEWLKNETSFNVHSHAQADVILGIGDDAAIVDFKKDATVISTDMLADGVHFVVGQTSLELIGRKSIAVNLSDIAAMAARPVCALVSLMLPKTMEIADAKMLLSGMLTVANEYGVSIAGGDTNRWDGPLVINVAITGVLDGQGGNGQAKSGQAKKGWRMDGAIAGDTVLVSGDFGHSIKRKHLEFTPRVALALYLRDRYLIHAATDITDSLALDLSTIARKSGLGMTLDENAIPVSQDAIEEYGAGSKSLTAALCDGEDFELAITVDSETAKRILEDLELPCSMSAIGKMTESKQYLLNDSSGNLSPLEIKGYEH